jgi:hypothetical protein
MCEPLPPIKIPVKFQAALREAAQKLAETLAVAETDEIGRTIYQPRTERPDLIVVLLRSAELTYLALEPYLASLGIGRPTVIFAHIGREFYSRFGASRGGSIGENSFFLAENEEIVCFADWLADDDYAQRVVNKMREDATAVGQPYPRRLLIFDDFQSEGSSLFAARQLIQKAFPTVTQLSELVTYTQATNEIVTTTFAQADFLPDKRGLTYHYLEMLLNGYREVEERDLVCLNTAVELELLGDDPTLRRRHIYKGLVKLYGVDNLLQFRNKVMAALTASLQPSQ